MLKKYFNMAIVYAVIALAFGVFYREFTKFNNFEGKTNLSVMHTHYFALGMFFFLILALLEKNFEFSNKKSVKNAVFIYNIGLNITGTAFLIRGLTQVWQTQLSSTVDASISGIAGIGHITLSICMIVILLNVRKKAMQK